MSDLWSVRSSILKTFVRPHFFVLSVFFVSLHFFVNPHFIVHPHIYGAHSRFTTNCVLVQIFLENMDFREYRTSNLSHEILKLHGVI